MSQRRGSTDSLDSLDAPSHDGHAASHRAGNGDGDGDSDGGGGGGGGGGSLDEARRSLEQMSIEEPSEAAKDPIHVRLSREVLRLTARVDGVVHRYVPAGVVIYFWGVLLAMLVLVAVWLFGGSVPRLKVPKHYQEPALQKFINTEVKPDTIRATVDELSEIVKAARKEGRVHWENDLVDRIESKLTKYGIPRHGVDDFWVYRAWPEQDGQRLRVDGFEAKFDDTRQYTGHLVAGNATGLLVFANQATREDLDWLRQQQIVLDGAVVLFKRDGSVTLGDQLDLISAYNASGAVVYWPAAALDEKSLWPKGALRSGDEIPQDDAALAWVQPGDVLTPGVPAFKRTRVLGVHDNPALAKIPLLAVTADDAAELLAKLATTAVDAPEAWSAGVALGKNQQQQQLKVGAADGDASPVAELECRLTWDKKTLIHNVLGELEGTETDQVLIVGTSLSAVTGVAVLLEVARVFAALASEHTWRPRRSVVFAFWAGTRENYLGSTEWAEDQVRALRAQGIAYIDVGNVINAGQLNISAIGSLQTAVLTALDATTDHAGKGVSADLLTDRELKPPHAFSDSTAYLAHVGLPTADIAFDRPDIAAECALSSDCIAKHFDEKFAGHGTMARLIALLTLELIDEKFVPLDVPLYVSRIQHAVSHLHTVHDAVMPSAELAEQLRELATAADRFYAYRNTWAQLVEDGGNGVESAQLFGARSSWNYAACQLQRNLMQSADGDGGGGGGSDGDWFGSVIYGPARRRCQATGKRPWTLPFVEDRLVVDGEGVTQALEELGVVLDKATQGLLGAA